MTIVSYISGSWLIPRVNCRPRGGCPVDRSKQWPSSKRCSSSYSAVTTPLTWRKITNYHRQKNNKKGLIDDESDSALIITRLLVVKTKELRYLLQVDVIQVMGAADSLHHPALWCDHIKGKKGRLWEFHEAGSWSWRHCVIGHERHIRLQDKAIKAAKRKRDDQIFAACSSTHMSGELKQRWWLSCRMSCQSKSALLSNNNDGMVCNSPLSRTGQMCSVVTAGYTQSL